MSSWEKWVFPQEVNAFPSPSFSLALPLHVAYSLPPPQTFHSVLFFPLFLTSSTLKHSTIQCSSHKFLCHSCETLRSMGRKAMMEEDTQCKNAKELVFTSICLTLNPYGGYLITDSCSQSSPWGLAKVKPVLVWGQEVIHTCPRINFSFLRFMLLCFGVLCVWITKIFVLNGSM